MDFAIFNIVIMGSCKRASQHPYRSETFQFSSLRTFLLSIVIIQLLAVLAFLCRFVNLDNLARLSKCAELGVGRSGKPLSNLFFATSEEFQYGLSCGSFNSVDLVSVS